MRAGVDLGGTKIEVVVVGEDNQVAGQSRQATPTEGGPPAVVAAMAQGVKEAAAAAGIEPAELSGVGVGSPGEISDGTVSHARNLADWEDVFPVAKELGDAVGA